MSSFWAIPDISCARLINVAHVGLVSIHLSLTAMFLVNAVTPVSLGAALGEINGTSPGGMFHPEDAECLTVKGFPQARVRILHVEQI